MDQSTESVYEDVIVADEIASSSGKSWHTQLLAQIPARDCGTNVLRGLYFQYRGCLDVLQQSTDESWHARAWPGQCNSHPPIVPGVDQTSEHASHNDDRKDQELSALRQLLHERDLELQNKDKAYETLCTEVACMKRENDELKARLGQLIA